MLNVQLPSREPVRLATAFAVTSGTSWLVRPTLGLPRPPDGFSPKPAAGPPETERKQLKFSGGRLRPSVGLTTRGFVAPYQRGSGDTGRGVVPYAFFYERAGWSR